MKTILNLKKNQTKPKTFTWTWTECISTLFFNAFVQQPFHLPPLHIYLLDDHTQNTHAIFKRHFNDASHFSGRPKANSFHLTIPLTDEKKGRKKNKNKKTKFLGKCSTRSWESVWRMCVFRHYLKLPALEFTLIKLSVVCFREGRVLLIFEGLRWVDRSLSGHWKCVL